MTSNEEKIREMISVVLLLADDIDPKVAKHLDVPPDGEDGERPVNIDECLEWLLVSVTACQQAAMGRAWFEGKNAREWAGSLWTVSDAIAQGDEAGLVMAEGHARRLAPHFDRDEEDEQVGPADC